MSGLQAANVLAASGVLGAAHRSEHEVIPIRDDEPQAALVPIPCLAPAPKLAFAPSLCISGFVMVSSEPRP